MTDEERWRRDRLREEQIRQYCSITGTPYIPSYMAPGAMLTVHVASTREYRRDIAKAADEGKPLPRKLSQRERHELKKRFQPWIDAMNKWARDPKRAKLPGVK